ncbi:hypothetical protein KC950_02985 [Candidatus Saccharibacteria bacterium]|nr:hypothetical protein [Candidatus Saccharibacteria bacterium]
MKNLIAKLSYRYPNINFKIGDKFYWSPESSTVFYEISDSNQTDSWTLLHETAHALLGHKNYKTDLELVKMELEAWSKAKLLCRDYDITIDNDYIEDCLDSYRDWLHQRSTCPMCNMRSLQNDSSHYQCFNCKHIWKVSTSRMCRPYRLSVTK